MSAFSWTGSGGYGRSHFPSKKERAAVDRRRAADKKDEAESAAADRANPYRFTAVGGDD